MRVVCAVASLCVGCYLSHERSDPPEGRLDGGIDAPALDVGVDAPGRCALELEGESLVAVDDDGNAYAPDIFDALGRIGVVVSEDNAGGFVHGTVSWTDTDSTLSEPPRTLRVAGEDSHGWGEAAWNGEGFGLCWSGDPAGENGTHFREVSRADGSLGPRTYLGAGSEACLDLVFAHGRYALARRHRQEDGMIESRVQVLGRDGVTQGEPFSLGATEYPGSSVTLASTDSGFIAVSSVQENVRILRFDRDARITSDERVPIGGTFTSFALRGDQIGFLTVGGERDASGLLFTILDEALRVVSSRRIADGAPTTSTPRVHARPEGWMLVWGEGARPSYRAMVLPIDAEGRPTAPRRVLHAGPHSGYGGPSLISVGETTFVGISHQRPGEEDGARQFTYVQRWMCVPAEEMCRPQEARTDGSADCARSQILGWRFDGEACAPVFACDSACVGADCDRLAVSRFACESDRRECLVEHSCEAATLTVDEVCGPTQVLSESPSWLETHFGGDDTCVCEAPACQVSVAGPFTLHATLTYCIDEVPDCDCADPRPASTPCVLPPLAPGVWTVEFEGRGPVTVESVRRTVEAPNSCR